MELLFRLRIGVQLLAQFYVLFFQWVLVFLSTDVDYFEQFFLEFLLLVAVVVAERLKFENRTALAPVEQM